MINASNATPAATPNAAPVAAQAPANPNASAIDGLVGAAPAEGTAPAPESFWEPSDEDFGKRLKVKIDGKEECVDLRTMRDAYQLRKTSEQRMSEIARERHDWAKREASAKAREAEFGRMLNDPAAMLEYLIDANPEGALQYVQNFYDKAVEYSKLTPAERKVQWFEKVEARRAEAERQQQAHAYEQRTQNFWIGALEASGMDANDPLSRTVYLEAEHAAKRDLAQGRKLRKADVADFMRKRYDELRTEARKHWLSTLKPEDVPQSVAAEAARAGVRTGPVITERAPQQRQANGQFAPAPRVSKTYDWMR